MIENIPVRIDKFLWAVRLYKTRTMATDACRMGRVAVNSIAVKPSRMIEGGEMLSVKKPPAIYSYRIKNSVENRLPAKLVPDYLEDLTPESEKQKVEISHTFVTGHRRKGTGRPTKKERRNIDRWQEDMDGF